MSSSGVRMESISHRLEMVRRKTNTDTQTPAMDRMGL